MDPALKAPPTQRPRLLPRPPRPAPAWWLFKDGNGRNEGITCLRRRVQIKVFLKFFPTPEEGQGRVCFRLSQRRGGGASGAQDAKKDKPEAKKKEAVRSTPQPHCPLFPSSCQSAGQLEGEGKGEGQGEERGEGEERGQEGRPEEKSGSDGSGSSCEIKFSDPAKGQAQGHGNGLGSLHAVCTSLHRAFELYKSCVHAQAKVKVKKTTKRPPPRTQPALTLSSNLCIYEARPPFQAASSNPFPPNIKGLPPSV